MANIKNIKKAAGKVLTGAAMTLPLEKWLSRDDNLTKVEVGPLNKLWRANIVLHRSMYGQTTANKFNEIASKAKSGDIKGVVKALTSSNQENSSETRVGAGYTFTKALARYQDLIGGRKDTRTKKRASVSRDEVIIYNLYGSEGYQYVVLQNRPNQLEFQGETSWATIKSMGRNVPIYQYTGAEDTIQFNVSWYLDKFIPTYNTEGGVVSTEVDETWVLKTCRLLESWSKADGYMAAPPVLQIQWGSSDLFKGHFYILESATYVLFDFRDRYRKHVETDNNFLTEDISKGGLYPMRATQELVFKRVSDTNLTYEQLQAVNKMTNTVIK